MLFTVVFSIVCCWPEISRGSHFFFLAASPELAALRQEVSQLETQIANGKTEMKEAEGKVEKAENALDACPDGDRKKDGLFRAWENAGKALESVRASVARLTASRDELADSELACCRACNRFVWSCRSPCFATDPQSLLFTRLVARPTAAASYCPLFR